jgi:hypothetical protein
VTLRARLSALESCVVSDGDPVIILLTFVGAVEGRPDGTRTDWHAHAEAVVVNHSRYPVGTDETAEQAVHRVVAAMNPRPAGVVAYVPTSVRQ